MRTALEDFDALKALVSELRGRMGGQLSAQQADDIGSWMLKAYQLGCGEPLSDVFRQARPAVKLWVVD